MKKMIAIGSLALAVLASPAWADPDKNESGHYRDSQRYWTESFEAEREAEKRYREMEREQRKRDEEAWREQQKHYEELRREARKHAEEMRRELRRHRTYPRARVI